MWVPEADMFLKLILLLRCSQQRIVGGGGGFMPPNHVNISYSKKVLLCEGKRRTARRVAGTRYAGLVGGTPPPPTHPGPRSGWGGGGVTPILPTGRYPFPGQYGGVAPILTWKGVPSCCPDMGMGYPPSAG